LKHQQKRQEAQQLKLPLHQQKRQLHQQLHQLKKLQKNKYNESFLIGLK
jgi:hypothetical protein